eukprot:5477395-Pyramimonas_sp.AAC.1
MPRYLLARSGVIKHGFRAHRLRVFLTLYRGKRSLQFDMRVSAYCASSKGSSRVAPSPPLSCFAFC